MAADKQLDQKCNDTPDDDTHLKIDTKLKEMLDKIDYNPRILESVDNIRKNWSDVDKEHLIHERDYFVLNQRKIYRLNSLNPENNRQLILKSYELPIQMEGGLEHICEFAIGSYHIVKELNLLQYY